MAKGLRSSRVKRNKSKLRSNIFGSVESSRKERLSAKLLELASKPIRREDDVAMGHDEAGKLFDGGTTNEMGKVD